jgi:hypothetical protein
LKEEYGGRDDALAAMRIRPRQALVEIAAMAVVDFFAVG